MKFFKILTVLFALSGMSNESYAQHIAETYAMPNGPSKTDKWTNPARFEGEIQLEAKLVGSWRHGIDDDPDRLQFYLELDAIQAKKLPQYSNYHITRIHLHDGATLLESLVSPQNWADLKHGKSKRLQVEGEFLIRDLVIGVDCDHAWASSEKIESLAASTILAFLKHDDEVDCAG
jgi:hypothetical protein